MIKTGLRLYVWRLVKSLKIRGYNPLSHLAGGHRVCINPPPTSHPIWVRVKPFTPLPRAPLAVAQHRAVPSTLAPQPQKSSAKLKASLLWTSGKREKKEIKFGNILPQTRGCGVCVPAVRANNPVSVVELHQTKSHSWILPAGTRIYLPPPRWKKLWLC